MYIGIGNPVFTIHRRDTGALIESISIGDFATELRYLTSEKIDIHEFENSFNHERSRETYGYFFEHGIVISTPNWLGSWADFHQANVLQSTEQLARKIIRLFEISIDNVFDIYYRPHDDVDIGILPSIKVRVWIQKISTDEDKTSDDISLSIYGTELIERHWIETLQELGMYSDDYSKDYK